MVDEPFIVGKRSILSTLQKSLGALAPEDRKDAGAQLQEARRRVEEAFAARRALLEEAAEARGARGGPARPGRRGGVAGQRAPGASGHPGIVAATQRQLEDVFVAMGFTVSDGPEVESDWYNFEALNIPPAHPARGMWDTFYVDLGEPETVVLRTHTSPTQIHLMENAVARTARCRFTASCRDAAIDVTRPTRVTWRPFTRSRVSSWTAASPSRTWLE